MMLKNRFSRVVILDQKVNLHENARKSYFGVLRSFQPIFFHESDQAFFSFLRIFRRKLIIHENEEISLFSCFYVFLGYEVIFHAKTQKSLFSSFYYFFNYKINFRKNYQNRLSHFLFLRFFLTEK